MRIRFIDSDLERLFVRDVRLPRFGPELTRAFRKKVGFILAAEDEQAIRAYKALRLEKLKGDREGEHSVRLNDQWRLILLFETDEWGRLVVVVSVVDYH